MSSHLDRNEHLANLPPAVVDALTWVALCWVVLLAGFFAYQYYANKQKPPKAKRWGRQRSRPK
jgi:predicted negative regulator of RcsB-dependent stress response